MRRKLQSETSFVNFDFSTSQALQITFDRDADDKITGFTVRSSDGKSGVIALKTAKPRTEPTPIVGAIGAKPD